MGNQTWEAGITEAKKRNYLGYLYSEISTYSSKGLLNCLEPWVNNFYLTYSSWKEKCKGHGHKLPPKCIPLASWGGILIALIPPLHHWSSSFYWHWLRRVFSTVRKHLSRQIIQISDAFERMAFFFTYITYMRISIYRLSSDKPHIMNVGWFAY